ncbi:hypothetical protein DE146DRAFT_640194 [Phaeosphaeria sp. MPI-PUGE-AT-0046c]|nr:hypothetical protein DE146DRAFT_640194 [Phaeosphaeria sp. MPI-PUGE-AT-0046c]
MYGVRTRASPATLQCTFCSRSFSRQEHLSRHLRIHTRERPFSCSLCAKSFARLDVLNRHKAAHEEEGASFASAAAAGPRACLRCASDRVRCSREQPCRRCSQRGFDCQFPAARPVQRRSGTVSLEQTTSISGAAAGVQAQGIADESLGAWPWIENAPVVDVQGSYSMPGLGLSDINWLSPQYQNTLDLDDFLAPFSVDYNFNSLPRPLSVANTEHAVASAPPPLVPVVANANEFPTISDSGASTLSSENRYYVDGAGARAPFPGHPPKAYSRDVLCPLPAYEAMLQAITSENQTHSTGVDLASIPTLEQVRLFVSKYFDNFHPTFPFLRRSSFAGEASSSWILLAAVAVVGSRFCYSVQDKTATGALSQVLGDVLKRGSYGLTYDSCLMDEDLEYTGGHVSAYTKEPPLHILQAGALNIACMLYSGKQVLFERGLVERHILVEACRKFGLFARIVNTEPTMEPNLEGGTSVADRWLIRETRVRLLAIVWALDTLLAYEFQAAPAIRLDAIIPLDLPVPEETWERPSRLQFDNHEQTSRSLGEALEMLYVEKKLPPELGDFSTWLLIMAIYRNTADVLAQDRVRLNSLDPSALPQRRSEPSALHQEWLPATRMAMKWRNSACDCLDILHWPANSRIAHRSGFEHHTILQLHLARIIILTPTIYIQTLAKGFATTGNFASSQTNDQDYLTARLQVLQWVIQDHCKARLSMVHCGALFWHVRRYSCDSLLEPFAIYIATLVLWAFCVSMQLPEVAQAIASESDETPEPSFLHIDRPLDDELVQTYVRLGHKMSAYMANVGSIQENDAPKKIAKEGLRLLAKKPQDASQVQELTTDEMLGAACTWGIERSYRRVLGSLAVEGLE